MTNLLKSLLLVTFTSILSCSKGPLTLAENKANLDSNLSKLTKEITFPGYAVTVFNDKETLYQGGFGYADVAKKSIYTNETIQPIASISKTFIAVSLMKAIEQGHFTLETKINDILPFKIVNPNFVGQEITIKHLVTHTSGLMDPEQSIRIKQSYQEGKKPTISLKDFIYDFYPPSGKLYDVKNFDTKLIGTTFNYSNYASALTAYLIEIKTGKPFSEYSQFIFDALKMNDTHWFYTDSKESKYAKLYDMNGKEYPIYTEINYASSTLRTSTLDLTKYMMEMIKGYHGQSTLLSAASFKTMFSDQYEGKPALANMVITEPKRGVFWAFGRSGRILHTGGDGGVSAFTSFDPVKKTGRILFINTEIEGDLRREEQMEKIFNELVKFEGNL
jgi:CubicO group peptidase (beta-lactamase class C family)